MVAKDEFPAEMALPNKDRIALPKERPCLSYCRNNYFNAVKFIFLLFVFVFFLFLNSLYLEMILKIPNITTTSFVTLWQSHNMKYFCLNY